MISWALFKRRGIHTAVFSVVINLTIFIFFSWFLMKIEMAWWWVTVCAYLINLAWAYAAWLFQSKSLGHAPRRYILGAWRSWLSPLLIGALIGVCIATFFSIPSALENKIAIQKSWDILARETILWDFFKYSFLGLFAGLFIGFWWAGEDRRFRPTHVITFLAALTLTITLWSLFGLLVTFLIHKGYLIGETAWAATNWGVVPPWVSGFKKYLIQIQTFDVTALFVVPLLFGAVGRLRDFGRRALLIPLTFSCAVPMSFCNYEWWNSIQGQIIYEMSSPDSSTRASAHKWAETILKRYPNHLQWPRIAEDVSRYYYKGGNYKKSRALYEEIANRYGLSNQWYWCVARTRNVLNTPHFGKPSSGINLSIPMVDYEEYLTHNWMALLSLIRYWEGPDVVESEVKIKLKNLSRSDDKILLNPMDSFADLDDAARNLGYEVLILSADLDKSIALMSSGIPIVHQNYDSFNLIFGFDKSRSAVSAYVFRELSRRLRKGARKEAKEILAIEPEGSGESKERLDRIANEATREYSADFWRSPALRHIGPLIAIVFPAGKSDAIAVALNTSLDALRRQSDGYLASLIGLSYLKHADPVHAVKWAKIGEEKTGDSIPLYIAYLAESFWKSRDKKPRSKIRLQDQFLELNRIFTYFNEPENVAFLKRASRQFEADLNANAIPWFILQSYLPLLERSDAVELSHIIKAMQGRLLIDPSSYADWKSLADTCEWAEDIPGMVHALKGAVSANPLDFKAKLRLAYGHVLLGQYDEAKTVLIETDPRQIKHDADYPFCLGVLAEWEGDTKEALKTYEEAVEMCRYKPIYHLRYGKLLMKEGLYDKASKVLEWVTKIDASEELAREAEMLLLKLEKIG